VGEILLTSVRSDATLPGVHSEVRKYGPFDKQTRKDKAAEIEQEVRPVLDDSAGLHAFGVADANDVLTAVTVYESRDAAQAAALRLPRGGAESEVAAAKVSVKRAARAKRAKRTARKR
jgi:hypothetical protein